MSRKSSSGAAEVGMPFLRLSPRWCFLLYACLAGLCLVLHNRMVDSAATDARRTLHAQVMANTAAAPLQYRVVTFYAAEGVQRLADALGVDDFFHGSYLLLRGLATFFSAVLLHRFLAVYFPLPVALLGTVLAFAWLPLTYINYYMQETDPLNMIFFLLGYELIRRRKDAALAGLLPLAMLNRETPVLLPLVWLLYRWDELPAGRLLLKFFGLCAAAFGPYFGLRFLFGHHGAYAEFNDLALNLKSVNSYLYFFLLFGALAVPAIRGFSGKPKFLRRSALFLPFFLVFHFVIPIFQETRLFLPIFPIVLALAFAAFTEVRPGAFPEEDRPPVGPWASKGKLLYFATLAAFIAGIFLYLAYLEKTHVRELREKNKAQQHVTEGYKAFELKGYATAAREWEWALLYDPKNFETHYNLAVLYAEYLLDAERAIQHLNACRRFSSADDPKLVSLEQRIAEINRRRDRAVRSGS